MTVPWNKPEAHPIGKSHLLLGHRQPKAFVKAVGPTTT